MHALAGSSTREKRQSWAIHGPQAWHAVPTCPSSQGPYLYLYLLTLFSHSHSSMGCIASMMPDRIDTYNCCQWLVSACPAAGEDSAVLLAREPRVPAIHGWRCPNDQLPHRFVGDQHGQGEALTAVRGDTAGRQDAGSWTLGAVYILCIRRPDLWFCEATYSLINFLITN
jgi:hypothetical protein